MLSGFDRAVGPVQPSEQPDTRPYECQVSLMLGPDEIREVCLFRLHDAGVGRTLAECVTHNYPLMAVDWTAPHFGGGAPLNEQLDAMRAAFAELKERTGEDAIDPEVPNMRAQRFGDIFTDINRNLLAVIEAITGKKKGAADGSRRR